MAQYDISLRFFDVLGEYAGRYWPEVPRVGDKIRLSAGNRYHPDAHDGRVTFTITSVVWGQEPDNDRRPLCVDIYIEPSNPASLKEPSHDQ